MVKTHGHIVDVLCYSVCSYMAMACPNFGFRCLQEESDQAIDEERGSREGGDLGWNFNGLTFHGKIDRKP